MVESDEVEDLAMWAKIPRGAREEFEHIHGVGRGRIPTVPKLDPNTSIQVANFGKTRTPTGPDQASMVPSQSQVLNLSSRSAAQQAVKGTFTVSRLNTTAPEWLSAANTNLAGDGSNGLYQCYYNVVYDDDSEHYLPFKELREGTVRPMVDTLWSKDQTWSWTVYEGLTPNPQASLLAASNLIIGKWYIGAEIQPSPKSAWTGFQKNGPKPSVEAMQKLMDGFYELKDMLPASYNFWGTLGRIAAKGVGHAATAFISGLGGQTGRAKKKRTRKAPQQQQQQQQQSRPRRRGKGGSSVKAVVKDVDRQEQAVSRKVDELERRVASMTFVRGGGGRPQRQSRPRQRAPEVYYDRNGDKVYIDARVRRGHAPDRRVSA